MPQFDKAIVCLLLEMPRGANTARIWDTSNRAINLILNNLKGVCFPDDSIEHMAFTVVGRWSETPKMTIFIGDFVVQSVEIMRILAT